MVRLCKWFAHVCQSVKKKLEDTKGAIRIRKSNKESTMAKKSFEKEV